MYTFFMDKWGYMKFTLLIVLLFTILFSACDRKDTSTKNKEFIYSVLKADIKYSKFIELVDHSGLKDLLGKETKLAKTIYVPTNKAFEKLPDDISKVLFEDKQINSLRKLVRTHFFIGENKELVEKNNNKNLKIDINGESIEVFKISELYVKEMVITKDIISVGNSFIIPIDCVMFLQHSVDDYRLDESTKKQYDITTCCLRTEEEVAEFLDGMI